MNDSEAAQKAKQRYEENLKTQKEKVDQNPGSYLAWDGLGDAYMDLDNVEEALKCFFKVIELDSKNVQTLGKISMLYQGKGDLVNARKYADMNFSYHPEHYKPNYVLVGLLLEEGKHAEAKPYNDVCLKLYPLHAETNFRQANIYLSLDQPDKAKECWENGTKMVYNSALSYCSRGQCYFKLGQKDLALADFRKAKEMIYDATSFTPSQKEYTRKALKAVLDAEDLSTKANAEIEKLNRENSSSVLKNYAQRVQDLQTKQKEAQDKVVNGLGTTDKEAHHHMNELERLKEEFRAEMNDAEAAAKALKRYEENLKTKKANVDQNLGSYLAWDNLGDAYMDLDNVEEALKCFFKVIELDSKNVQTLGKISMLYQGKGDRENAMKYAKLNYSYHPGHYKPNYVLVGLLLDEGKHAEAKPYNDECLKQYPLHAETNFRQANIYLALGEPDKAKECWENGTKMVYNSALSYCSRGQCYYKLGKKELAFADFKKAKEMIFDATSFTPSQKDYTRKALKAVLQAEETSTQMDAQLEKLQKADANPLMKRFTAKVQDLKAKQKEAQDKVVSGLGGGNQEADKNMSELERLKEEFNKQMAEMKAAMSQMGNQMQKMDQRITHVENSLDQMKEELDNKLDDFHKKLDKELDKQDLPSEDKTKLKGYFKAFLETFSSGYVTAQVVASGQIQLDAGSAVTSLLSTLASFAPFVGSVLESGINTVGEFLKTKEMITSARKMKGLAPDTSRLSQIIGKAGYEVILDKNHQKRVIKTTDEELRKASGNLFKKIMKFCENLQESVDSYLYSSMYNTAAERLGHNDANFLIEKWIKAEILPFDDVPSQFKDEIIKLTIIVTPANNNENKDNNRPTSSPTKVPAEGRSSCCNMF